MGRSLRRSSHPISYTDTHMSHNSPDSGLGIGEGYGNRNAQHVSVFSSSPDNLSTSETDITNSQQPQDESRKRVRRACEGCRRKKSRVRPGRFAPRWSLIYLVYGKSTMLLMPCGQQTLFVYI